jgi:hypothetical protein
MMYSESIILIKLYTVIKMQCAKSTNYMLARPECYTEGHYRAVNTCEARLKQGGQIRPRNVDKHNFLVKSIHMWQTFRGSGCALGARVVLAHYSGCLFVAWFRLRDGISFHGNNQSIGRGVTDLGRVGEVQKFRTVQRLRPVRYYRPLLTHL